jgi:hypothetical protein
MTVSPAQAVWAAYEQILENECVVTDTDKKALAAAISVVADQVVPEESEPIEQPFANPNDPWPTWYANKKTRRKILAIAAELDGL